MKIGKSSKTFTYKQSHQSEQNRIPKKWLKSTYPHDINVNDVITEDN